MISVLIPVYREAPLLDSLLSKLLKDGFRDKEVVVSMDKPTEESRRLVKKYGRKVRFNINEERMGKAKSLNKAVRGTSGDTLLFMDSDVKIVSKNFLSKIEEEIRDVDVLDIKKTLIDSSYISRLSNYEYMTSNFIASLFSMMRLSWGFNGAAFAIKREAFEDAGGFLEKSVSEDIELGMQCYLKDKAYKYSRDIEVSTKSKDTWNEWMVQRRRWGVGTGQFFKHHWKDMTKALFKHPQISLMALFFLWPIIFTSIITNSLLENFFLLSLLSLSFKFSFLLPIFILTGFGMIVVKNLVAFAMTYSISAALFYIISRRLRFSYNIKYFTFYYIFYYPIWASVFYYNFLKALVTHEAEMNEKIRLADWKVHI